MTAHDPDLRGQRFAKAGGTAAPRRRHGNPGSSNGYSPLDELKAAANNVGEIGAYARQFVGAKVAGLLYGIRKLALLSMLGAVVGVAGISFLVTCAVLFVLGISDGVGALLPERLAWLGKIVVGLGGVALAMLAVYIVLRRAAAVGKRMALEQYRTALRDQRKRFGHDAFGRSAASAAEQDLKARQSPARTEDEIEELRKKQVAAEKAHQQLAEDFQRIKGE